MNKMDLEIYIGLGLAVLALAAFLLKAYRKAMADGKLSISEAIDMIEGSEELVKDVVDKAKDAKADIEETIEKSKE